MSASSHPDYEGGAYAAEKKSARDGICEIYRQLRALLASLSGACKGLEVEMINMCRVEGEDIAVIDSKEGIIVARGIVTQIGDPFVRIQFEADG